MRSPIKAFVYKNAGKIGIIKLHLLVIYGVVPSIYSKKQSNDKFGHIFETSIWAQAGIETFAFYCLTPTGLQHLST